MLTFQDLQAMTMKELKAIAKARGVSPANERSLKLSWVYVLAGLAN